MFNTVFWIGIIIMAAGALLAYGEKNFTVTQQQRRGITKGLPFARHLGMWSDIFLVCPALGIIWTYADQIRELDRWVFLLIAGISLIITAVAHQAWCKGAYGQEHILSKDGLTYSGYFHVAFMALTLMMIVLFYFTGLETKPGDELVVALLLGIHVPISTIGVNIMKVGKPDTGSVITTLVCWAALAGALIR